MKSRFKHHSPMYVMLITMIVFILIYFYLRRTSPSDASKIVITILAIIAGVAFWLEYRHNSRVNEAQFVMDLNDQFITDEKMSSVEHDLEVYYAAVREGRTPDDEKLREKNALEGEYRQHLVNYLVHLEGVATLVNNGVLRISTITDLMAYRYFIAVNNKVVQDLELIPYKDFYQGIINVFSDWSKKAKETMPMKETRLDERLKKAERQKSGGCS